jgi:hypothetical protein
MITMRLPGMAASRGARVVVAPLSTTFVLGRGVMPRQLSGRDITLPESPKDRLLRELALLPCSVNGSTTSTRGARARCGMVGGDTLRGRVITNEPPQKTPEVARGTSGGPLRYRAR